VSREPPAGADAPAGCTPVQERPWPLAVAGDVAGARKFIVGVSGIVTDPDGRVLLLRPRYWSAATWGLPGGYLKSGETPAQALIREVREETGLSVTDAREVGSSWGFRLRAEVQLAGSLGTVVDVSTLTLSGGEIEEACFCSPDALPDGLLAEHRARIAAWAHDPGRA